MLRSRLIPFLLLHKGALYKTINFKSHKYIGDPINAVKIFNEKLVDELIITDIDATVKNVEPNYSLIEKLARVGASVSLNIPLYAFPIGVLAVDKITA